GTPFSIASRAAFSSAGHEGGGEPALAMGRSRPCWSWKTTQRSASVVSTVACATASSTRSITPDEASVWPTARSRSRSRGQRRVRVSGGHDVEAHGRQPHLEHLEDRGVIVDDQNPARHWTVSFVVAGTASSGKTVGGLFEMVDGSARPTTVEMRRGSVGA